MLINHSNAQVTEAMQSSGTISVKFQTPTNATKNQCECLAIGLLYLTNYVIFNWRGENEQTFYFSFAHTKTKTKCFIWVDNDANYLSNLDLAFSCLSSIANDEMGNRDLCDLLMNLFIRKQFYCNLYTRCDYVWHGTLSTLEICIFYLLMFKVKEKQFNRRNGNCLLGI